MKANYRVDKDSGALIFKEPDVEANDLKKDIKDLAVMVESLFYKVEKIERFISSDWRNYGERSNIRKDRPD